MTPTEVWEGFNPVKEPLETSIISSEDIDNLVHSKLFFTSENTSDGKIRAFAELYYDRRWKDDRPAILLVPNLFHKLDYSRLTAALNASGYAVCLVDYAGSFSDGAARTTYPESRSYARFPECEQHMNVIESSARQTPWFEWCKVVRRAISMLGEMHPVDPERIAVFGLGVGAQIAWQVAAMDGRITSLVAVNGGGYIWNDTPRFTGNNVPDDDAKRAFSTGVGAETYARFVSCPACYVVSTNSVYADMDRAGDIVSLVPAASKMLLICKGTDLQISSSAFQSLLKWLKNNFAHDTTPVSVPSLVFEQTEGKLYLRIKTEKQAAARTIYVSYGEPRPNLRYWTTLSEGQKVGKHEYVYFVPVYDLNELIVAYASVGADDSMSSSFPVAVIPSQKGVTAKTAVEDKTSRIVYNGSMGTGSFSAVTNEIFLDDSVLHTAVGPFNLTGVSVSCGELVLFRGIHERFSAERDAVFQFDAYSAEKRVITVKLVDPEMKTFTTKVSLEGGEFWQKVSLTASDFKSAEGRTLGVFSEIKQYVFSDANNVVFNNLLWI